MPGSKRQRDLARRRAERQAARRREAAARRRKQRLVVAGTGIGVLALVLGIFFAVRSNDDETPSANACGYTAREGETSTAGLPEKSEPDTTARTTTVEFDAGTVTFDMLADVAPCTVNSFAHLAAKKFFDGTKCHRVLTEGDFVVQCGDPTATGRGGPGYSFKDENLPQAEGQTYLYPAGTVAMANSGPNTNGSQFFLVVKDSPFPPNYAVFGRITKGLDVLEKFLAAGVAPGTQDAPAQPINIKTFTVAEAA